MTRASDRRLPFWSVLAVVTVFASIVGPITVVPFLAISAMVVIDAVLSWATLRFATITVAPFERAVEARQAAVLELSTGAVAGRLTAMVHGTETSTEFVRGVGVVAVPPARIGVMTHADLDLSCTHLGMFHRRRRMVVPLTEPLDRTPTIGDDAGTVAVPGRDDLSRIRGYLPGDRPSRVNWAATARTGNLMVRAPSPVDGTVTVVVDAGVAPDLDGTTVDDGWLDEAATLIDHHVERSGEAVRLVARELTADAISRRLRSTSDELDRWADDDATVVDADVYARDDLARRLARVVPGPPHPPIEGALVIRRPGELARP